MVTRVHDRLATALASGEMQSSTLICNNFLMFAGGLADRTVLFTLMFRNPSNGMTLGSKWASSLARGKEHFPVALENSFGRAQFGW